MGLRYPLRESQDITGCNKRVNALIKGAQNGRNLLVSHTLEDIFSLAVVQLRERERVRQTDRQTDGQSLRSGITGNLQ